MAGLPVEVVDGLGVDLLGPLPPVVALHAVSSSTTPAAHAARIDVLMAPSLPQQPRVGLTVPWSLPGVEVDDAQHVGVCEGYSPAALTPAAA